MAGLRGPRDDARARSRRRLAPAPRARLRDPPRAADRVPRRADRRRRSAVAPPVLAADRRAVARRASPCSSPRTTWTKRSTATASRSSTPARSPRIGTAAELKQVFAGRPIVEIRADAAGRRDARARRDAGGREDQPVRHRRARRAARRRRRRPSDRARGSQAAGRRRSTSIDAGGAVARGRVPRRRRARRRRRRHDARRSPSYRKELRQIVRDRRTLLILLFVPAFFLLLYGYALNFDIRHIALAVRTATARPRAARWSRRSSTPATSICVGRRRCADESRAPARSATTARAVLVIPEGFGRDVGDRPRRAGAGDHQRRQRQHRDDGHGLCRRASCGPSAPQLAPGGVAAPARPSPSSRASGTTRELRSTLFLVPGLIAYIAMITAVDLHGAVGRPREGARHDGAGADGADRHASRSSSARRMPYFVISLASAALDHSARRWCCSTCRCAATGWRCCVALSLFLVGALATGLLISTIADTQQVAFQIALLIVVPADADAVGVHLSDRQHAAAAAGRSPTSCRRATSSSRCAASCSRARRSRTSGRELAALAHLRGRRCWRWRRCAWRGSGPDMQRLRFLDLEGVPRAAAGSAAVRHRHRRADLQLTLLGYAATTDVKDVPVVVVDGDRSPASRELIARFEASRNFTIVDTCRPTVARSSRISSAATRGWRWRFPPDYGDGSGGRPAGDAAGGRRRHRLELDDRRAGLRDER